MSANVKNDMSIYDYLENCPKPNDSIVFEPINHDSMMSSIPFQSPISDDEDMLKEEEDIEERVTESTEYKHTVTTITQEDTVTRIEQHITTKTTILRPRNKRKCKEVKIESDNENLTDSDYEENNEDQKKHKKRKTTTSHEDANNIQAFNSDGICKHGRTKCEFCRSLCHHGRGRYYCKDCKGGGICEHNKRRSTCRECKGSSYCKHNKVRYTCIKCKGCSICKHKRKRADCKECNGASICKHGKKRYICVDCKGKGICKHKKQKFRCKLCKENCHRYALCKVENSNN